MENFTPVLFVAVVILFICDVAFPMPFSMLFREAAVIAVPDALVSVHFFWYKIKPYVSYRLVFYM